MEIQKIKAGRADPEKAEALCNRMLQSVCNESVDPPTICEAAVQVLVTYLCHFKVTDLPPDDVLDRVIECIHKLQDEMLKNQIKG